MVLPEPYFSLSDSRDTSCAIRFFSEPVPQLRDSWDNTWCYRKPRWINNVTNAYNPMYLQMSSKFYLSFSFQLILVGSVFYHLIQKSQFRYRSKNG